MAVLGQQPILWAFDHGFDSSAITVYDADPVILTKSGVINGVGITINDWSTATQCQIALYTGAGADKNIIGYASYTPADGTGVIDKPLSGTIAALSGQSVWGLIAVDAQIRLNAKDETYTAQQRTGALNTLPSVITPSTDDFNSSYAFWFRVNGTAAGGITIGGITGRQRPIGRGPAMNRTPGVFRRQQGAITLRQCLLQLFSAPGVPLANTAVTFWTSYNNSDASVDGPIVAATDSNGLVLLSGLIIAAGAGKVRCEVFGDVRKARILSVTFQ